MKQRPRFDRFEVIQDAVGVDALVERQLSRRVHAGVAHCYVDALVER